MTGSIHYCHVRPEGSVESNARCSFASGMNMLPLQICQLRKQDSGISTCIQTPCLATYCALEELLNLTKIIFNHYILHLDLLHLILYQLYIFFTIFTNKIKTRPNKFLIFPGISVKKNKWKIFPVQIL